MYIQYMKKFRNSDWLSAVRLIPNSAIMCYHSANLCLVISANFCYHILAGKTLHGKNKYGGQGSANSANISLKFEVNSTLILPVKCSLTKLEESQCYNLTFSSINERTKAFLIR